MINTYYWLKDISQLWKLAATWQNLIKNKIIQLATLYPIIYQNNLSTIIKLPKL
jgi:hypothetical protein